MRFLILFIFSCTNIYGISQSLFNGENKKEIIRGNKITKERIYNYAFHRDQIIDSTIAVSYTYDMNGDITEEKDEKTKNTRETIIKNAYWYNSKNRLIKQISEVPTAAMVSVYEYEYDSLGNEITKYDYNKDTTRLTIEQKVYNDKNQLAELWIKIDASELYNSRRYFYNENGELSRIDCYNRKGQNIYSYSYEDDKLSRKKTLFLENEDGKKVQVVCEYNPDNLPVKIYNTTNRLVDLNSTSQTFDNFDQVTEYTYNQDNTIFQVIVYLNGKKVKLQRHYYFKF
ncbi:MAG TPA: hypothetical protein VNT20_12620 [Flavisolibacter sp.]|jgi:hypothetical protein|nr:hypothetical protein [Flavisolibacter sp.]